MPYSKPSEVPESVPAGKKAQFMEVFNSAYAAAKKKGMNDKDAEQSAFAQAWGVIKKAKNSDEREIRMKGDPQVMVCLQQAIDAEATLDQQYMLDARNVKRYGMDALAKGLSALHEQCESYVKQLIDALLLLGGAPQVNCGVAKLHAAVGDIISDAINQEFALTLQYAKWVRVADKADDLETYNFFIHLIKRHKRGGKQYKGHLRWLEKQQWQLKEFSEVEYEKIKVLS